MAFEGILDLCSLGVNAHGTYITIKLLSPLMDTDLSRLKATLGFGAPRQRRSYRPHQPYLPIASPPTEQPPLPQLPPPRPPLRQPLSPLIEDSSSEDEELGTQVPSQESPSRSKMAPQSFDRFLSSLRTCAGLNFLTLVQSLYLTQILATTTQIRSLMQLSYAATDTSRFIE